MLKLELRMDKERIVEVGEYDPDKIMERIDNAFLRFGFRKEIFEDGTICFLGNRQRDDFAHFASLILALKKTAWFMDYVDKWLWYNSDGQYDEECYNIEDVLYHYTKKRSMA